MKHDDWASARCQRCIDGAALDTFAVSALIWREVLKRIETPQYVCFSPAMQKDGNTPHPSTVPTGPSWAAAAAATLKGARVAPVSDAASWLTQYRPVRSDPSLHRLSFASADRTRRCDGPGPVERPQRIARRLRGDHPFPLDGPPTRWKSSQARRSLLTML